MTEREEAAVCRLIEGAGQIMAEAVGNKIDALNARVAELERENEALRIQVENLSPSAAEEGLWNDLEADRERLDWLDGERGCVRGTDVAKWSIEAEDETVDSIREAIDAAMEAAKG